MALNLRTAVTAVSPVLDRVSAELGTSTAAAGLLGTLPPFAFAVFGALTPWVARRVGLERTAVLAMVLAGGGQLLRAAAPDTTWFLAASLVALGGMGAGNVVLPPLVKRWFPDRIGAVTGLYVLLLALCTALPPLLAVPVADAAGWRTSVGQWALVSAAAAVPWVVVAARDRRAVRAARPAPDAEPALPAAHLPLATVLRSPVAWGLAALLGMTSLNTYAMFAWLPKVLTDAGLSDLAAGTMLSLFAAVGMPVALLVPWVAARVRNPFPVVLAALVAYAVGYTGLALAPTTATALWVVAAGLGPSAFPLSLALVNLRSRTPEGSAALSGFSQGVGYLVAGTGPLVVAALRESTGGWGAAFAFLAVTLAVQVVGGAVVCRPRCIEDDLDDHRDDPDDPDDDPDDDLDDPDGGLGGHALDACSAAPAPALESRG
ncbi:MFS transporter [Thalassiella azotivora]